VLIVSFCISSSQMATSPLLYPALPALWVRFPSGGSSALCYKADESADESKK
jgi:hypothetical protein